MMGLEGSLAVVRLSSLDLSTLNRGEEHGSGHGKVDRFSLKHMAKLALLAIRDSSNETAGKSSGSR